MRNLSRRRLPFVVFVFTVFVLAWGGGSAVAQSAKQQIKIGVLNSLTGPIATYGLAQVDGVKLYIDEVNKAGGINGHQLALVTRDDKSNAQVAVIQLQELINDPDIVAVLGPASSNSVNALKPITHRDKIPLIMYAAVSSLAVGPDADYLYRVQHSDGVLLESLLATIKENLKGSKLGIMYSEDAYGASGTRTIESLLSKYGIQVVAKESFQTTETDMAVQATRMKAVKPDAVIIMATIPGAAYALRSFGQVRANIPVLGPQLMADIRIPQLAGTAAEGTMFAAQMAQDDPAPGPQQELARKWQQAYGKPISIPGVPGYASAMVLADALKKLTASNRPITRQSVRDALNTVDVVTPGGRMTFTPDYHDGPKVDSVIIGVIKGGKFVRRTP